CAASEVSAADTTTTKATSIRRCMTPSLQTGLWTSGRPIESVAEITQARDDELVGVELLVHDRREDGDVGMHALEERHAFRGRHDADHADRDGADCLEQVDGGGGA